MAVVRALAVGCGAVGAGDVPVPSGGARLPRQPVGALPRRRTHDPVEIDPALDPISRLSPPPLRPSGRRTHRTTG